MRLIKAAQLGPLLSPPCFLRSPPLLLQLDAQLRTQRVVVANSVYQAVRTTYYSSTDSVGLVFLQIYRLRTRSSMLYLLFYYFHVFSKHLVLSFFDRTITIKRWPKASSGSRALENQRQSHEKGCSYAYKKKEATTRMYHAAAELPLSAPSTSGFRSNKRYECTAYHVHAQTLSTAVRPPFLSSILCFKLCKCTRASMHLSCLVTENKLL